MFLLSENVLDDWTNDDAELTEASADPITDEAAGPAFAPKRTPDVTSTVARNTRRSRIDAPVTQRYVPSEDEIRAACLEIQQEWSEKERRKRSGLCRAFWLGRQCRPSRFLYQGGR